MTTYFIEAGLIHLSLYLVYLLLLRKETHYQFRRLYLIAATVASIVVPFLDIPLLPAGGAPTITEAIDNTLSPVIITGENNGNLSFFSSLRFDWSMVFVLIMVLFLLYLMRSVRSILINVRKSVKTFLYGIPVRLLKEESPSFSFFKWIFIGKDKDQLIILHEKGHSIHGHTIDVLMLNVYRAVFWWLPSSWWVLKELRLIHEYQADAYALQHADAGYYKKLLIGNALSSVNLTLASSFHHGTLLKRLKAMQAEKQIISKWKVGALGALVATVILVFSCSEQLEQDVQEISANASLIVDYPLEVQQRVELLMHETGAEYSVMEFHAETDKAKLEKLIAEYKFAEILDLKESDKQFLILSKDDAAYDVVKKMTQSDDGVFDVVDEKPAYEGGIEKFYQFIGSNMKYPEQARKMGIQGKVYVRFVINEDGSISNVEAVKGIGAGCDAAAMKIVASSNKWKPGKVDGKKVRTRLMVPIIFKLDDEPADS